MKRRILDEQTIEMMTEYEALKNNVSNNYCLSVGLFGVCRHQRSLSSPDFFIRWLPRQAKLARADPQHQ